MKAQRSRRSCGEGKTTRDDCISGKRGSKGFELFAERSRAARKTERRSSMSLRFGLAAALKRSIVLFFFAVAIDGANEGCDDLWILGRMSWGISFFRRRLCR